MGLFLISVFTLFLELLLIRWVSTEVRIFAYLQNTVLIVCFLGLGVGCFTAHRPARFRNCLIPLLILTALIGVPYVKDLFAAISPLLSVLEDFVIWFERTAATKSQATTCITIGLSLTLLLIILIWETFLPLGRILGALMDEHPNTIVAYTINIAGSLIGILLFAGLSALSLPPLAWFIPAALLACYFVFREQRDRIINLCLLLAITFVAGLTSTELGAERVYWSPYQKLVLRSGVPLSQDRFIDYITDSNTADSLPIWSPQTNTSTILRGADFQRFFKYQKHIAVNNVGYQGMVDLRDEQAAVDPELFPPEMRGLSQYHIPSVLHSRPKNVLIVGAGSGNDAAGALAASEATITAVEIDPVIIQIGKDNHPNRPYDSPRVRVVNDDARSFFATTDERYDVISFGLLDSHTTTAMTNARLDHYVYTKESIERARELLNPGGIITLSFEAQKFYIADRMARVLRDIFDAEPLVFRIPITGYGWGGVMFVVGDLESVRSNINDDERLNWIIERWSSLQNYDFPYQTKLATDDWPYIYLKSPRIPSLYYLLGMIMLLLLVYAQRRIEPDRLWRGWQRSNWHFFFLGAAFLLLEVQNISKAAVVLGNTWVVNAVIISAILIMILLANLLALRLPRIPLTPVYVVLLALCIGLYFIDLAQFAFLPYGVKTVVVGGLTTIPMLFAGIIFIRSFATCESKSSALGANLTGSIIGALLQSLTFIVGIKALLLVVAALYASAYLSRPREQA